jgi:hypothetical protein
VRLLVSGAIVVGAVAGAVALFLFFRRRAPEGGYFTDGDRAAGVFGVLATGFSVLLGFVVFLAFTSYDTARSGARREATDVAQQYETAQLFPRATSARLGGQLFCYGRSVIHIEWPALRKGEELGPFNPWGLPLFETFRQIVPRTAAEQIAYSKWLDQREDREQARLDRVQAGQGVVPSPLWIILLVSAGLVSVYAFFFVDRSEGAVPQALIAGSLATMLATSLLVIRFFDNPYRPGLGALQPTDMERVLDQMAQASAELKLPVRIPCDRFGHPLVR